MFQKIKKLYISKNRNITKKSHWKKGEQLTVTLNAASVKAIREEGEEEKAEKWQNNLYDNYKTTTSIKIEETTRRQEFNYLKKGSSISSIISSNRERVVYQSCSCNISSNRNQDIKGERRPQVIEIFRFGQKMANTISVMTNVLRNAVSKQRIRYKEKGFNLDLAYICDNIIAMGYPADNLEKIYRNPLEDVYKFLEENHRDRYKIYNLCLERSYDVNKFHGRVSVYPFEDHNPPTIELIQRFCADVDEWLKADTNNVAAVHCKAGKGRTGTMICCYLIYSNQQQTAEDALAYYDEKRTKDRKGVTIPSQRRYVQYFAKLLRSNLHYTRRSLEFFEIRFTEAHALYSQGTVNCSISALEDSCGCLKVQTLRNLNIDFRKSFTLDMKNFALRVSGDIKIELTQKTSKKKILHFWFNTYFVYDSAMLEGEGENAKLVYTLNKWEIDDAHKDKEHKMFSDDFKVQLAFYNESNDSTDLNRPNDNHHLHRTYPATTPSLPVLRGTVPVPAPAPVTMTVTTKPCESSNSSNSEMQIICDEQATGIGIGGGGGTYENLIDTKPYGNHHQDTNTKILTDRRPTSLITLNDTNSSPHKIIQQQQQQQHHRRSVTNTTTSGNHQRQLLQIQHKINTCSSNNHQQQQQQQQHNNHIQIGKTTMRNINNQSNMSNSSNSSINSHITSVSSSASMASTSGGIISGGKQQQQQQQLFINDFNEKHEDDIDDDDEDEDEDNHVDNDDDDDDDEDDADREDNEEDWESGESAVNKPIPTTTTTTTTITTTITTTTTISPIRFNEKQLVTNNRTTNSTTNYTTLSTTTTTTTIPKTTTKNAKSLKIKEKHQKQQEEEEKQHQQQMKKNSSGSSTSSSNYFNEIGDIVHFYNDNGNKVHIDNNYIDDVDDDDDENDNDNDDDDDDNMLNTTTAAVNAATTNNYANNNIQCAANPTTTTTFDNDDTKSAKCTNNNINNNNKQLMSNLVARYKFMHLLTAKASNKVMAPRHSYFKRKSLKTKSTTLSTTCTTEASASVATQTTTKNINCLTNDCYMLAGAAGGNDCVDGVEELRTRTTSVGNSGGCAGGVGGGLAKASKLKLKLGLSKTNSKLKWTQKFHWLQNYVRSADAAADLHKSFAQTTTTTSSQRLNSNSSGNATTTTTTTNTNTSNCNGIKNSTPSQIVGSSCTEDYYSSICDNQLSFNNSPCKSPRSQKQKHATHVAATATATAAGGPIKQTPTTFLVNDDVALRVVVVAARPANIEAIGFNVTSTTDTTTTTTNISSVAGATATVALGTCNMATNGSGSNSSSGYATASTLHSDSSIYSTPPTSVLEQQTTNLGVVEHTHHHEKISPFIFPNISAEITELAHVLKSSNIDTKTTATTITTTTIKNGSVKHNIDNDNENDNDDEFDEHNNKQA